MPVLGADSPLQTLFTCSAHVQNWLIFWSKIFNNLGVTYGLDLDPHRLSALFGVPSQKTPTPKARHSMAFCTLSARRLILLCWKQASPPSYNRWIKEVLQNLKPEKLRFSLRGSLRKFTCTWNPLLSIIDLLDIMPDDVEAWCTFTHIQNCNRWPVVLFFCFVLCVCFFVCIMCVLSFLTGRGQRVKVNGLSSARTISTGSPPGSIISPLCTPTTAGAVWNNSYQVLWWRSNYGHHKLSWTITNWTRLILLMVHEELSGAKCIQD